MKVIDFSNLKQHTSHFILKARIKTRILLYSSYKLLKRIGIKSLKLITEKLKERFDFLITEIAMEHLKEYLTQSLPLKIVDFYGQNLNSLGMKVKFLMLQTRGSYIAYNQMGLAIIQILEAKIASIYGYTLPQLAENMVKKS